MAAKPKASEIQGSRVLCTQPACGKTFSGKPEMLRHLKSSFHVPYDQRPFGCKHDGCDRRFTQRIQIIPHDILKHGAPRLECPELGCDVTFADFGERHDHKVHAHGHKPRTTNRIASPMRLPKENRKQYRKSSSTSGERAQTGSVKSTKNPAPLPRATSPSPNPSPSSPHVSECLSSKISLLSPPFYVPSTCGTPAAPPTSSTRYSSMDFPPSSSHTILPPATEDSFVASIRHYPSGLTSRNIRHHDEQSSSYGFSPYLRASSSRRSKGSTSRSYLSSPQSHFTGLTTPPDSPVASPEVVCPSMSTSLDPTFHFGYPTDAAWSQEVAYDTYSTGGDISVAKSQPDMPNAHFQYELPAYDAGAVQSAQQGVFQGHHYPTQQLPTSMAPMNVGYNACTDRFAGYVDCIDIVAISPPQQRVEQQVLASVTQATMEYPIYSSLSAEYIDTSAAPLDQSQVEPDYSGHSEWPLELDASFTENFNYALAACGSGRESMVPTMFGGPDGYWMNGTWFASY